MQKVLVIQGCKECPHVIETDPLANLGGCKLYEFMFEGEISETPHPDCKMNDLPSDIWKIIDESTEGVSFPNEQSMADTKTGAMMGANFVIERIKK